MLGEGQARRMRGRREALIPGELKSKENKTCSSQHRLHPVPSPASNLWRMGSMSPQSFDRYIVLAISSLSISLFHLEDGVQSFNTSLGKVFMHKHVIEPNGRRSVEEEGM